MPPLPRVLELFERAPETLEPSLFFQRLIDDRDQLCDVERLKQIAGRAVPKPVHRGFRLPLPVITMTSQCLLSRFVSCRDFAPWFPGGLRFRVHKSIAFFVRCL